MLKLTEGQRDAVLLAMEWYYLKTHYKTLLVVAGLAGSGKSTVVKYIVDALGIDPKRVLYCAFTGKAVSVLRLKGHTAQTMHKAFYNARKFNNNVTFTKKRSIPSHFQLIVWDEFGMVEDTNIEDVLSFGVPVIGLGDNKQLEPLYGQNSYMHDDLLDIFLDQVMRSSDASGILTLAGKARLEQELIPGKYGLSRVLGCKEECDNFEDYDVVLVWTNKTRRFYNALIRHQLKLASKSRYPLKGEKIYFLQNRYDEFIDYYGIEVCIVNGLDCVVLEDAIVLEDNKLQLKVIPTFCKDDYTDFFTVEVSKTVFDGYYDPTITVKEMMEVAREEEDPVIFCDWSYSVSVHASQGSEYGRVLVIDEMHKGRPEYSKWLYTAITRAKGSVDVLIDQKPA